MRRRTLLLALPLTAALASCGVSSQAGSSSTSSATSGVNPSANPSAAGFTVKDVAGREVHFEAQPQRIVMNESRQAYSLAFLNKENPIDKVVAWGNDLQSAAPDFYEMLVQVAPKTKEIPNIGSIKSGDLTVETLLSYEPDVVVLTLDAYNDAKQSDFINKMESQGLQYVVTDFRRQPVTNTVPSVKLLGEIFDCRQSATKFLEFYSTHVDPVVAKAKTLTEKPTTFMWRAPGLNDPCATYGQANLGGIIAETGGNNIAIELLQGAEEGVLTPEQIIASDPQNIIATGGEWGGKELKATAKTSYVHLGYKADAESAKASLAQLRNQPGFDQLQAFDKSQVFAVYHQFYDAPYNFIAYLAFAKWQNPQAFNDLDPQGVWESFHEQYMPWKAQGVFITGI